MKANGSVDVARSFAVIIGHRLMVRREYNRIYNLPEVQEYQAVRLSSAHPRQVRSQHLVALLLNATSEILH